MSTLTFEEFAGYNFELTEEPNSTGRRIICTELYAQHIMTSMKQ